VARGTPKTPTLGCFPYFPERSEPQTSAINQQQKQKGQEPGDSCRDKGCIPGTCNQKKIKTIALPLFSRHLPGVARGTPKTPTLGCFPYFPERPEPQTPAPNQEQKQKQKGQEPGDSCRDNGCTPGTCNQKKIKKT